MGGEWGNWVMVTKKGTRCDERWGLYTTDELPDSTSETNDTRYVNGLNLKKLEKNKKNKHNANH